MNNDRIHILKTQHDWEGFLQAAQTCQSAILFKFSPTCPISHSAESRAMQWLDSLSDNASIAMACIDVIAARALSRQIAEELNVQHQSPQAIRLSPQGQPIWDASHGSISVETLTKYVCSPDGQQADIN